MSRIPIIETAQMNAEQRMIHEDIVNGRRGKIVGPLKAAIHSPDLARLWAPLGEFLRYNSSVAPRLSELAILVTARHWGSEVEWWIHAEAARKEGLSDEIIEAIRAAKTPVFRNENEAEIYEYTRHLQGCGAVPDPIYRAVRDRHGIVPLVELTALIGYYTMVSMTLNAHEIDLPEDIPAQLNAAGLTSPPQATRPDGSPWVWNEQPNTDKGISA